MAKTGRKAQQPKHGPGPLVEVTDNAETFTRTCMIAQPNGRIPVWVHIHERRGEDLPQWVEEPPRAPGVRRTQTHLSVGPKCTFAVWVDVRIAAVPRTDL